MTKQGMWWAGLLLLSTTLGWGQSAPDKVCEVNLTTPKPGSAKMFEAGRKKHNLFHKAEKDKTPIIVWSILTGPATGSYLTTSCGMAWKDMDGHDAFDKRDAADIESSMAPAIAANQASYYVERPDLSSGTDSPTPSKMISVTHFFVKPANLTEFTDAVKKINAAIGKTKYPVRNSRWYSLGNGGEGPHFVLVSDRNSWADMQGPEQSMMDMLKQAYGDDDKTMQNLRDSVDHTISELLEYRADLSYIPAK